ncbi:hypothetical protein [Psychroserpens sp. MEBiC05023]
MKLIYITLVFVFLFMSNSFAQQNGATASEQKQIERYEEESKRRKLEYLNNFMATLQVDDFQKEIIFQTMDTYFDELIKINRLGLKSYERETHIEQLDKSHFKDVKAIVSEDVMSKIMDAVKGKWDKKAEKKKKKRKRKNKN